MDLEFTMLCKLIISTLIFSSLFSNIEGSIIAKAVKDDKVHSQAAILANITHEYLEFGTEAFKNNTLQTLFITTDQVQYVAKPIFNLILCFICSREVNLGLVKSKVRFFNEIDGVVGCDGRVFGRRTQTYQRSFSCLLITLLN